MLKGIQLKFRPMSKSEKLFFGTEFNESFCLETKLDSQKQRHLTLFRNGTPVEKVTQQTLVFLRYLAKRSEQRLFEEDILHDLWRVSTDPSIVEKYVSLVRRTALGDTDNLQERFIGTQHKHGYTFKGKVISEGELDTIEPFSKWDRTRFYDLIDDLKRSREEKEIDLRILTTAISAGSQELDLERLLSRGVRIRVLILDPDNEVLFNARHALRTDKKDMGRLRRELTEQIGELEGFARKYPVPPEGEEMKKPRGTLEYRFLNSMPCGSVFLARAWALLGIFLAHKSYVEGPMFEIQSESEAWKQLRRDWRSRWGQDEYEPEI